MRRSVFGQDSCSKVRSGVLCPDAAWGCRVHSQYHVRAAVCRFLFDLSREVQDLVGQLRDRARDRERRIKHLEVRCAGLAMVVSTGRDVRSHAVC